jgi:uncharacterized membrane protein (UPF0127 family)
MWLCADERVLASAEVASTRAARRRGLLGRDSLDGALVLPRTRAVHTIGMRFAIDVAYLDGSGVVLAVRSMQRWRVGIPRWRARMVVEAEGGAFERWGVSVGDRLEVR